MKTYTHEEVLNEIIGEKGTERRDEYDEKLKLLLIGDAIRLSRQKKNLTQEELGVLLGVKKSQVSRLEHGTSINFQTASRIFSALGIKAKIVTDNGMSIRLN